MPVVLSRLGSDEYGTSEFSLIQTISFLPNGLSCPPLSTRNALTKSIPDIRSSLLSNNVVSDFQSGSSYFLKPRLFQRARYHAGWSCSALTVDSLAIDVCCFIEARTQELNSTHAE